MRPFAGGNAYSNYGDQGDALRLTGGGQQTQAFVAGTTAFTGTTTVDLSFLNFVVANLIGNIEVRDNFGQPTGVIIGQFMFTAPTAVPEGKAWLMLPLAASVALIASGVRRCRQVC